MAERATQICIGLENKPGALASLCDCLLKADINVDALFVSVDEEFSWVNLLAHPVDATERALAEGKYHYYSEPVLTLRATNKPGELHRVATKLAEAGININYVYGSTGGGATFTLVLNVSNLDDAAKLLDC